MNQVSEQPFFTKNNKIVLVIAFVLFIGIYLFTANNYQFYSQTILKVTKTTSIETTSKEGVNGNEEQYYSQNITGKIMNGSKKGETITFEHEYSYSEVFTEKYHKGDRLFIEISSDGSVSVTNMKRDQYVISLIVFLFFCLLFLSKRQGALTILSLVFNLIAFYVGLTVFELGSFLAWGWVALVFFFCIVTLTMVSGFHRKTIGAILSSLVTVGIIYVLYKLVVSPSDAISYEMISYAYGPLPLKNIYMVSVLFGSLGAIMDVCITINSSVCELIAATETLTIKKLIASIQEIGYDIMGTMVNVMFFSYISSSLPIVILKIQSGFGIGVIYRYEYIFDIVRFLLAAIGIVLAIPISGAIATLLAWKGLKQKGDRK